MESLQPNKELEGLRLQTPHRTSHMPMYTSEEFLEERKKEDYLGLELVLETLFTF